MSGILLTQYSGIFIGPVAKILGYLMEGIHHSLHNHYLCSYAAAYY